MIVQMIGRAGRSPFEKYGRAYILTRLEHVVSFFFIENAKWKCSKGFNEDYKRSLKAIVIK